MSPTPLLSKQPPRRTSLRPSKFVQSPIPPIYATLIYIYAFEQKPRLTENENPDAGADTTSLIRSTSEGDKYLDLGKKKRATVSAFKGTSMYPLPIPFYIPFSFRYAFTPLILSFSS